MRPAARNAILFLILPGLAALATSCQDTRYQNAFIQSENLCLQVGGKVQISYEGLACQKSFNRERKSFRVHSDNMSDYYQVVFETLPEQMGDIVNADLEWTTETDILTRKNLAFEVVRTEGGTIWLWSKSARIGLSIQILD